MKEISSVGQVRIGRNKFNLNHRILGNCDSGQLIPVMFEMCIPGDIMKITHECIIRALPLVTPMLQEIEVKLWTFFTPLRIIDKNFEEAITGGEKGEYTGDSILKFPKWQPLISSTAGDSGDLQRYSLWDYFGFREKPELIGLNSDRCPVCWLPWSYGKIFDEYFRDEWLQDRLDWDNNGTSRENGFGLPQIKNWRKDYFTAALPQPYKGSAPSLPINGTSSAVFSPVTATNASVPSSGYFASSTSPTLYLLSQSPNATGWNNYFNRNTVDLSTASTFDWNDLRSVAQITKWLERNSRAGSRYTEFLSARFDVNPQDFRLQRPEFIGSSKAPIVISEVLQNGQPTNSSALPQGNMAGHGISATINKTMSYKVQEHGIIMTLMCICPKRNYVQGIDRMWTPNNMYDMVMPEFTRLGEREIFGSEIYADGTTGDSQIFGFRGIYDEYRSKVDRIVADMRDPAELGDWSMLEIFGNRPQLNSDFIKMSGDFLRNPFAVTDKPTWIYHVGNHIEAFRPLPIVAEPGLIDHF